MRSVWRKIKIYPFKKTTFEMWIFFIFLQIFVWIAAPPTTYIVTSANEGTLTDSSQTELNESITEQIEKLDLSALQEYVDSLSAFSNQSVGERLLEYIKGGKFDYQRFDEEIINVLIAKVLEILPFFACIAAITLLSGVISTLKSGTNTATTSEMIFLITYAAALIPLIGILTEIFSISRESISSMQTQIQIVCYRSRICNDVHSKHYK